MSGDESMHPDQKAFVESLAAHTPTENIQTTGPMVLMKMGGRGDSVFLQGSAASFGYRVAYVIPKSDLLIYVPESWSGQQIGQNNVIDDPEEVPQ